jgi:hypothetical protein
MRKARLKAVADEWGMTLADFGGGRIVNDKKLFFNGKTIKQGQEQVQGEK